MMFVCRQTITWSVLSKLKSEQQFHVHTLCQSKQTIFRNRNILNIERDTVVSCKMMKFVRHPRNIHTGIYFSTTSRVGVGYKLKEDLKDCYKALGISDPCTQVELKDAYFEKAKLYHPDSKLPTADVGKFEQVKDAYKSIKVKLQSEMPDLEIDDSDDEDGVDFTRRQPQHRQYLSFQGVGIGTMSQRQKQFEQHKVSKAMENVYKYKIRKITPEGESALVTKDKKATRKRKIYNAIDRLVEDLIQDSMSRGDFDNLKGYGKPQIFMDSNPYIDNTMAKLNKIMINDDLVPEWINTAKEIRNDVKKLRETLAMERQRYGYEAFQTQTNREKRWSSYIEVYKIGLTDINMRINKYNLIVPILNKQMAHFDFDREFKRICDNYTSYLPKDFYEQEEFRYSELTKSISVSISWKEFWKNIRGSWKA